MTNEVPENVVETLTRKTCVVVADGGRARFFTQTGEVNLNGSMRLREVEDMTNPEGLLRGSQLFSSTSGGRNRAPNGGYYGTDDHRAGHLLELERRFARSVADAIKNFIRREAPHKLVLAAAPTLLGLLRRHLPAVIPAKVRVIELAEDLSRHTPSNIQAVLVRRGALSNAQPEAQPG
jgi:protein required for attachment to host cells